jgi:hypothetical protein
MGWFAGMGNSRRTNVFGVIALAGYGVHATFHLWRGEPEDLLWVCHLAAAIVGAGLISRSASVIGMGTLILCMGTPLWVLDLAQGSEFMPTSLGTHGLGLVLGLWGVWKLGMSAGAWWKAALAIVSSIIVSRLLTPAPSNVNLAFAIPPGMDRYFTSHFVYLAFMVSISCAYFWIVEVLLRRIVGAKKAKEITP